MSWLAASHFILEEKIADPAYKDDISCSSNAHRFGILKGLSIGIVASGEKVELVDYGYGLLSFLTVAFGGLGIGVLMGLLSGLLTRATREVQIFFSRRVQKYQLFLFLGVFFVLKLVSL